MVPCRLARLPVQSNKLRCSGANSKGFVEMDQLIKIVNKLQDAFAAVNVANPIDLPQIVVIGSQSSGKSSVLENIVGRDFLPRGQGIVTRRPLVLQLINRPADANKPTSAKKGDQEVPNASAGESLDEWGEFLHRPGQKYYNFDRIMEEIVSETDSKTGNTKNVSPEPINLRIYSPHVLTLTLVDLPGLTKVPVGGQPKDIEKQIRDMIMKYIVRPNAIILAVTAANTDLANSDGLKLAREVDPDGLRTIGVLTKIDLMDKGTDVVDILKGKVIPLRLGYVPVVNRGQKDIEGRKSIKLALDAEREYFENHASYGDKAAYCGTPFLARKLNMILLHHIRSTLPEIKQKISTNLAKYQAELLALGDISEGTYSNALLSIITEFTADFRNILDGNSTELSTTELNGGARVSCVLHEIFYNAVSSMDPFDQIKEVDIRTLLYNSSGSTPALFVATSAFAVLMKQQIKRLEDPCLKCVVMVYDELVRILSQLLQKPIFKRFPQLKERFYASVINVFKRGLDPTNKLVTSVVSAETCYIYTAHPDFVKGHQAMAVVYDKLQLNKPALPPKDGVQADKKGAPSSSSSSNAQPSVQPTTPTTYTLDKGPQSNDGVFSSFFAKQPNKRPGVLEPLPAVLKASGTVSEREFVEIEVIKLLLTSYYNIVKRTITDMVPKCIMLNLVNYSSEELQRGLLAELYKEELLEDLLKESADTVTRRRECKRMIEALQKADEIVSTI